jgi:hypothetical protein
VGRVLTNLPPITVIPAKAGTQLVFTHEVKSWAPAFAGVTAYMKKMEVFLIFLNWRGISIKIDER